MDFIVDQLAQGGAERHAIQLANTIAPERFEVTLSYLKPVQTLMSMVDQERVREIDCIGIRHWLDLGAARRYGRRLQTAGTDVVVAANAYSTLYAVVARLLTRGRFRIVSTFHTTLLTRAVERIHIPIFKWAIARCESLVFMSDAQRRYWEARNMHARTVTRIYNGVDVDWLREPAATPAGAPAWSADDYRVGICAGLRPEKAHADLLRACALLAKRSVPVRLMMIGDGAERAALERLAASLDFTDRLFITGFQSDVRPWLRLCNVAVLPSRTETFSLASLEAMAMGVPMVMSDVGGAREQVTPGETGLVFPQGDVEALADRLATLRDAAVRVPMGERAQANVTTRFSVKRMIDEYEDLIERVAATRDGVRATAAAPSP